MMTRAEMKLAAKAQIKGKLGTFFLAYLMLVLFSFVASLIPFAGPIISALVSPSLTMGLILITLMAVNNQDISLTDFFNGFNYFVKALLLFLLTFLFTFLWSLLFIVPGIVKGYAYRMAPYILAENPEMSPLDCITASKNMTNGYKGDMFVIDLSFLGWMLLVAVTFGIAGIYVYPYYMVTYGNFYVNLKNKVISQNNFTAANEPSQPQQPADEQKGPEL